MLLHTLYTWLSSSLLNCHIILCNAVYYNDKRSSLRAEKMQKNYRPSFNLKCRISLSNHFLVRFKSKTKMFAVKIIIRDKDLGKKKISTLFKKRLRLTLGFRSGISTCTYFPSGFIWDFKIVIMKRTLF